MGQLKDEATNTNNEGPQEFVLTDPEVNYLRLLNIALQYHTLGKKIVSGFLYYVSTTRLGYQDGCNLQFMFDFAKEDNKLQVTLLPDSMVQPPAPQA